MVEILAGLILLYIGFIFLVGLIGEENMASFLGVIFILIIIGLANFIFYVVFPY